MKLIDNAFMLIRKWLGIQRTGDDVDMPDPERKVFKQLYKLSKQTLALLMAEADGYMSKSKEGKTKHKRDLFKRKFNNTKKKFQAELGIFNNLQSIVDDHDIDVTEKKEK